MKVLVYQLSIFIVKNAHFKRCSTNTPLEVVQLDSFLSTIFIMVIILLYKGY